MKRYLQCAEQQMSPSNLTNWCSCHQKLFTWLVLITYTETSFTIRDHSENDSRMKPPVRNPPHNRGYFYRAHHEMPQKYNISRSGYIIPNLTQRCPCNEKCVPTSPNTASARKSDAWTSPNIVCLLRKVTLELHEMLCLTRKVTLDSAIPWLFDCLTLPLPDRTLLYSLTFRLLLDSAINDSITWRFYYHDSVTWRFCYYWAILLLNASITWRFLYCFWILDDSITWRFYCLTCLLLDGSITWRF